MFPQYRDVPEKLFNVMRIIYYYSNIIDSLPNVLTNKNRRVNETHTPRE